jgi:hypothetical protein
MRPRRKKYRVATALLFALWVPWSVDAATLCPIEIVGTWKATAAEPQLLSFSSDGWANLLGADREILAQVQYRFVPRREQRRIEFQTRRGNDLFPAGNSHWEITAYTDESFSARSASDESSWTRVQTHRYFLTLAGRGDTTLFVMWTTLDGNTPVREALGTTAQGTDVRFGRIPQQIAKAFVTQSERGDDAMLRVELSEAEYLRTHQVFVSWDNLVSRDLLAREQPKRQALLLLDATLQNMNRCSLRIRTVGDTTTSTLQPLDLVGSIRKLNDRLHVPDKAFPLRWQPPPAF